MKAEEFAKLFWDTYERRARNTAVRINRWDGIGEMRRTVMIDTCREVLQSVREPVSNWSAMSTREVFDALKAAPKVAGPWERVDTVWRRADVFGLDVACGPHDGGTGAFLVYIRDYEDGGEAIDSTHHTRAEADARLRELGWLLVDEPEKP